MIAAIVVLYRPDIALLERGIQSVSDQVEKIYMVDNTAVPLAEMESLLLKWGDLIQYFPMGSNKGIAAAQNLAIAKCLRGGYSHMFFLDQDTVVPAGLTDKLLRSEQDLVDSGTRVSAVGPLFVDQKTQVLSYAIRYAWFRARKVYIEPPGCGPVEADWLISAGSLIRSSVLEEVGMMREDLFIDWVDAEWGLRARLKGFENFIIPDAIMEHSIGDDSVELFSHSFNMHSVARNYYIVRNATYLLRPKDMGWKWVTAMLLRIPKHIAVHTWYSEHRWRSFVVMMSGVVDGARGHLGPMAGQGNSQS
jgi:rhamnosyltransferase